MSQNGDAIFAHVRLHLRHGPADFSRHFTVNAYAPALTLARQLIRAGYAPDHVVEVYRGTAQALGPRLLPVLSRQNLTYTPCLRARCTTVTAAEALKMQESIVRRIALKGGHCCRVQCLR
jgi:hypothetical protein